MTQTLEFETITEVLELIDRGLGSITDRSMISSSEVTDMLLDVRSLLVVAEDAPVN